MKTVLVTGSNGLPYLNNQWSTPGVSNQGDPIIIIRNGQYGAYIMKTTLKKPQFVSLPKGIDGANLTEKEVDILYKNGIESKKKKN